MPNGTPDRQVRMFRAIVGAVYLACAVMVVVALVRFADTVLPRYGQRFSYMLFLFGAIACWLAFRGVQLLRGGRRGGGERERGR